MVAAVWPVCAERFTLARRDPRRTARGDVFGVLRRPHRWRLGRSDSECQADRGEHVDQRVKAELADLSVQEIRHSGLGHMKPRGSFGLRPTFFPDSLLDRNHEQSARGEVGRLLWCLSEVVEHAVSHLLPLGSASWRDRYRPSVSSATSCEDMKDANRVAKPRDVHKSRDAVGVLHSYLVRAGAHGAYRFVVVGHQPHLHSKQLLTEPIPDVARGCHRELCQAI